jgi:nucleoside-diphosphate-sugar epimerase
MGDLAQLLISKLNPSAKVICDEERLRPEKSEVNRLLGCNRKIMELTDWKPQYTFEQGVEETIDFLRENIDRYKSDSYNI